MTLGLRTPRWFGAGLLCALGACGPDLTPPTEVVRPRILATRIEVEGEPTRSTPQLGEAATLRFQVGFPRKPGKQIDVAGVFCLSATLQTGAPYCLAEVALTTELTRAWPDEVQLRYELPSEAELLAALGDQLPEGVDAMLDAQQLPDLMMFGAMCVGGKVRRVPGSEVSATHLSEVFECTGQGADPAWPQPELFTKTLATAAYVNRSPDMACRNDREPNACAGIERDGEPRVEGDIVFVRPGETDDDPSEVRVWEPLPSPPTKFTGCANDDFFAPLRVRIGDDSYYVRLRFDPWDRQPLPPPEDGEVADDDGGPRREELFVYAALTEDGGSIDAYLRLIEADVPNAAMEVEFEYEPFAKQKDLEREVPPEGRLVRFYFYVNDRRGGGDFTERALCLLPPEE